MDPAKVRSLFSRALSLPEESRARFLEDCEISGDEREEVLALLRADLGAEACLRRTVNSELPMRSGVGEEFGPFKTTAITGRGGMGVVFRAERVDGALTQTVAIKVIDRAWFDPRVLERFRQERQMLAVLEHANIARFIDAGAREDGTAYLVMEYVDGLPLDEYCDCQASLSTKERLRLFLPLCDAIEYAHQKLIIHRDLKPSNVLVTASGQPKLLDFGIARVFDANSGAQTQTIALTPDFASPEQLRGEGATIATDVYGLGAILYFLLTGRAPHAATGRSPEELCRAICEIPPERPSAIRPELSGDLENILLKALHSEPERRYASARELAEDLKNYLTHLPVRATPDSRAYRTKRFVQRHTFASAAGGVAALAILNAAGIYLYEAHRAQQRFNQVRELANRFVFDFEAAIRDTPGTLAARRMAASTGRRYLADLAADAGHDPALRRELAEAHYRLSDVEMAVNESAAAFDHIRMSLGILKDLKDDCCGSSAQRKLYCDAAIKLAVFQRNARTPGEGLATANEALLAARGWIQHSPQDPLAQQALASALSTRGELLSLVGRLPEARQVLEEAVERLDGLVLQNPDDNGLRFSNAQSRYRLAYVLGTLGETTSALDTARQAASVADPLLGRISVSNRFRQSSAALDDLIASFLKDLAKQNPSFATEALAVEHRALTIGRQNAQMNPDDGQALNNLAVYNQNYGEMLVESGRAAEALAFLREAATLMDRLVKADASQSAHLRNQVDGRRALAECLIKLARWGEGSSTLLEGEEIAQRVIHKWPDDLIARSVEIKITADLVLVERKLGRLNKARELCRQGLNDAATLSAQIPAAKAVVNTSTQTQWLPALDLLRKEARILGVPDPSTRAH